MHNTKKACSLTHQCHSFYRDSIFEDVIPSEYESFPYGNYFCDMINRKRAISVPSPIKFKASISESSPLAMTYSQSDISALVKVLVSILLKYTLNLCHLSMNNPVKIHIARKGTF